MIACTCEVCTSSDPHDKRLRSSVLIEVAGKNLVIDTTPDFRMQMLQAKVKHLDAVLITHSHKDHIAGMDDVRAFNYFQQSPIDIYATNAAQEVITREFAYAFTDIKYPGIPDIRLNTIDEQPFEVKGIRVIPIQVWHYKMPVLGYRIGNFTYITDANRIPEKEKAKIRGSAVLVMNALRRQPHISHFSLDEALALADELAVPQVYFTHISHQMGLHAEVSRELKPGRSLAYDGLVLELADELPDDRFLT
ncbi:MAG: MBL fold metallo-hydrolase [Thermoflavifilum sp.]|nr:MBL fold metallo-hydrolase [Thermoflavifilum sp.]